ncbi:MAG: hypothetical protein ACYTBJ_00200 [Planctomycetota bacterium]|jgi:hypothetical protein
MTKRKTIRAAKRPDWNYEVPSSSMKILEACDKGCDTPITVYAARTPLRIGDDVIMIFTLEAPRLARLVGINKSSEFDLVMYRFKGLGFLGPDGKLVYSS